MKVLPVITWSFSQLIKQRAREGHAPSFQLVPDKFLNRKKNALLFPQVYCAMFAIPKEKRWNPLERYLYS